MNAPPLKHPRACPRCGYDFDGIITTWTDACPMHGTCSECGLEFDWCDVLGPLHRIPTWFLEHPYRRAWRTFMPTYVRSLRPAPFWRAVRITFPIMRWRLAQFAAEILITFHLIVAYLSLAGAFGFGWFIELIQHGNAEASWNVAKVIAWPYRDQMCTVSPKAGSGVAGMSWFYVYSPTDAGVLIALFWCVLMPFAFLLLRRSMRSAKVRTVHLFRVATYSLAPLPVFFSVYALLSIEHQWWQYTITPPLIATWTDWIQVHLSSPVPGRCWMLAVVGLWLVWTWFNATKHYLRLRHAAGVALAMMTVAGLASVLLALGVARESFMRMMD